MAGTAAYRKSTSQSDRLQQDEAFLRKAFHASLLPCILSILSQNINILADGILVGQRIGTDGLSAISLCVPVYLVLCVIGSFLVSGTAIQASKAIGPPAVGEEPRNVPNRGMVLYCGIPGRDSRRIFPQPPVDRSALFRSGDSAPGVGIHLHHSDRRPAEDPDLCTLLVPSAWTVGQNGGQDDAGDGSGKYCAGPVVSLPLGSGDRRSGLGQRHLYRYSLCHGLFLPVRQGQRLSPGTAVHYQSPGLEKHCGGWKSLRPEQYLSNTAAFGCEYPADGGRRQPAGGCLYRCQLHQRLFPEHRRRRAPGRLRHAWHLQRGAGQWKRRPPDPPGVANRHMVLRGFLPPW